MIDLSARQLTVKDTLFLTKTGRVFSIGLFKGVLFEYWIYFPEASPPRFQLIKLLVIVPVVVLKRTIHPIVKQILS